MVKIVNFKLQTMIDDAYGELYEFPVVDITQYNWHTISVGLAAARA